MQEFEDEVSYARLLTKSIAMQDHGWIRTIPAAELSRMVLGLEMLRDTSK